MTSLTSDQLFERLHQAKGALTTLTPAYLSTLNDDEFEYVVSTVTEFFNSVQSLANHLAVLRRNQHDGV
jgi:hypothetical protein